MRAGPTLADLEFDGRLQLIGASLSGTVYAWDLPGKADPARLPWPTSRHDNRRSGAWSPSPGAETGCANIAGSPPSTSPETSAPNVAAAQHSPASNMLTVSLGPKPSAPGPRAQGDTATALQSLLPNLRLEERLAMLRSYSSSLGDAFLMGAELMAVIFGTFGLLSAGRWVLANLILRR